MKKKPRPYKVSKPEEKPQVKVSLNFAGTVVESKGDTVLTALRALKKPAKITTKSVITITKGEKTHSRPLTIPLANRLFYPGAQIYHAKFFEMFLK